MANGLGASGVPPVALSANAAPRGRPGQSCEPSLRRGPSQIRRMISASASVKAPHSPGS
jgi:hypothetical protein